MTTEISVMYGSEKVKRDHSLHTPHYMVLGSYMVCDVFYCNLTILHMVPVAISNNIQVMYRIVSRAIVTLQASYILSSVHIIGLLSYERYSYFFRPLTYTRRFTKCHIYTTVIIIYFLALCVGAVGDVIGPRRPVASIMMYQTICLESQVSNIFYGLFYIIPSCIVSVITLIRLRLLISKHKAQVQPIDMNEDQTAVGGIILKPVKKALKMVGLVSGSFWLTIIPGYLIRVGLSASEVTWAYTDHRISLSLYAISRASYMLITVLSSVLNPIIYLSVITELRESAWKCFGIKQNSSDIHSWDYWIPISHHIIIDLVNLLNSWIGRIGSCWMLPNVFHPTEEYRRV